MFCLRVMASFTHSNPELVTLMAQGYKVAERLNRTLSATWNVSKCNVESQILSSLAFLYPFLHTLKGGVQFMHAYQATVQQLNKCTHATCMSTRFTSDVHRLRTECIQRRHHR